MDIKKVVPGFQQGQNFKSCYLLQRWKKFPVHKCYL